MVECFHSKAWLISSYVLPESSAFSSIMLVAASFELEFNMSSDSSTFSFWAISVIYATFIPDSVYSYNTGSSFYIFLATDFAYTLVLGFAFAFAFGFGFGFVTLAFDFVLGLGLAFAFVVTLAFTTFLVVFETDFYPSISFLRFAFCSASSTSFYIYS